MQEIEYSTRNEANSLIIERDILTKTIFRVYQQGSNLTKIQRDKLLTRYQHQLGVVVTKIEELGNAMRNTGTNHSDEGLFAAMEQKLSRIDERLEEMSSRKTPSNKRAERQAQRNIQSSVPKNKKKPTYTSDVKLDSHNYGPLEITTLTQIPNALPEFFKKKLKPSIPKTQHVEPSDNEKVVKIAENVSEVKVIHSNVCEYPDCTNPKFSNKHCSVHTDPNAKESTTSEKKVVLSGLEVEKVPQAEIDDGLPDDSNLEDDDVDISALTKKMNESLDKLDQAEVE
ncbi:hypothetical protein HX827_03950 [Marine Group I thaumarchaeote]|uniref:Uncharacterized protein n=1 Tax=Marine Group I thaumarchaeote TaxID=2511932 RepID=A0A7K4NTZ9_9ARCH|nr:hypothetical protein [Marine Group I thaumarchaeote]